MESPNQLKRRRSWFSKGKHDDKIEVLSYNNEEVQITDPEEDINPIDQSSPKLEAEVDTGWIDTKTVHNDIEELKSCTEHTSLHNTKRKLSIQTLLNPGAAQVDNLDSSSEEQIKIVGGISDLNFVSEPKSQGSLGKSVTPLKIRDNINHFLKLRPSPEREIMIDLENLSVFEKVKSISKSQNNYKYNNLTGVPCSRLGLIDHNQCAAFMFQLNNIRRNLVDYAFYYDWVIWLERATPGEKNKEMYMDRIIETKSDLKLSLKMCKRIMQDVPRKIHISKVGTTPRRLSQKLTNSGTMEFCVPVRYEYCMFKELSMAIMDNLLYKPQDIQLPVCAITYKRLPFYSIISLWLSPPKQRASEQDIFPPDSLLRFAESIREILSPAVQDIVDSAVFIENETISTRNIYDKKLHQNQN